MDVMLFLSSIVLELMNKRASPVKMTDRSFGEYILSLCVLGFCLIYTVWKS